MLDFDPIRLNRSKSNVLFEHDLFRKPVSTFRDHALPERGRLFGLAADAHVADLEIRLRAVPHAALLILEHVAGAALAIGRGIFHDLARRWLDVANGVGV